MKYTLTIFFVILTLTGCTSSQPKTGDAIISLFYEQINTKPNAEKSDIQKVIDELTVYEIDEYIEDLPSEDWNKYRLKVYKDRITISENYERAIQALSKQQGKPEKDILIDICTEHKPKLLRELKKTIHLWVHIPKDYIKKVANKHKLAHPLIANGTYLDLSKAHVYYKGILTKEQNKGKIIGKILVINKMGGQVSYGDDMELLYENGIVKSKVNLGGEGIIDLEDVYDENYVWTEEPVTNE